MPGLDLGRRYESAPIAQAIMEFYVASADDLTLDQLSSLQFGDEYGEPDTIYQLQSQVQRTVDGGLTHETREDRIGFAFTRSDGSRRVEVAQDRFTFFWLSSYTDWRDFYNEVEAAWTRFRDLAKPQMLRGIGVRFVNHIPLPTRPVEIKDYLRLAVDVPAYLPQEIRSLFLQVEMPLPQMGADVTITSALLPEIDPGGAILLDIDVKTAVEARPGDDQFDSVVSSTLDRLRLAKNYVFEACITDATRGMIG